MPIATLTPADLRLTLDPASLGFSDTSELIEEPLPWIGQARAEAAARFGLGMVQPNYNLFVLGEVGSGRSSTRPNGRWRCACRPVRGGCCASRWRRQ